LCLWTSFCTVCPLVFALLCLQDRIKDEGCGGCGEPCTKTANVYENETQSTGKNKNNSIKKIIDQMFNSLRCYNISVVIVPCQTLSQNN
jgi:hypothetical protein